MKISTLGHLEKCDSRERLNVVVHLVFGHNLFMKRKSKAKSSRKEEKSSAISPKKNSHTSLSKSLRNIKMFVMDVDGCLTDGTIWLDSNLQWRRSFNVLDGVGIKLLMEQGYIVAVITGGNSEDVRMRVKFLGIEHFYDGASDKTPPFENLIQKTGLKANEIAYVGDEIYDVPIIKRVGFSACPPRAIKQVQKESHYVTKAEGGYGAIREVADLILEGGFYSKK